MLGVMIVLGSVGWAGDVSLSTPIVDLNFATGFRAAVAPERAAPVIGVRLTVDAGGRADPVGGPGLAHLVEHLAFRAVLPSGVQVQDRLDSLGCTSNAFTEYDRVSYYVACPSSAAAAAFGVLGQWMTDPLAGVTDAVFAGEARVVSLENALVDHLGTPEWIPSILASVAPDSPYAQPLGGTPASVAALHLAGARAWVADAYRPARASV